MKRFVLALVAAFVLLPATADAAVTRWVQAYD